jgi:hypothetical protein
VDNDSDDYVAQVVVSWAENTGTSIPKDNAERIALIKTLTADWAPQFRGLIEAIPNDAEARGISLADWSATTTREHERMVVMGDAAHSMTMCTPFSPFIFSYELFLTRSTVRGEGGNNAVADAHDFVKRVGPLLKPGAPGQEVLRSTIEQALRDYDQDVLARGHPCVVNARQACLDAHDFPRITDESPLVSRRSK